MGQQIVSYFSEGIGRVLGFLPNLLSAIVILIVGYALSRVLGSLVRRLLMRAHFDNTVSRRVHARATEKRSPSATLGATVFWLGMLVTLSLASRSLGLLALAGGINSILAFVPNVIVAAIILGVAVAVGNVLAGLVGDYAQGWLGKAVKVAIIALAAFMALDQLGIASTVVATTFTALLGAAAVAFAIAFGVGNIQLARDFSARLARRGREREREEARPMRQEEHVISSPYDREPPGPSTHAH